MSEDNLIHLTADEIKVAEILGLTLREYACAKKLVLKEEAERQAWLLTPAGIKHMANREAKRQHVLKLRRENYARKKAMNASNNEGVGK